MRIVCHVAFQNERRTPEVPTTLTSEEIGKTWKEVTLTIYFCPFLPQFTLPVLISLKILCLLSVLILERRLTT
jgi:hypothetical protein